MLPRTLFRQLSKAAFRLQSLAEIRSLPISEEIKKFDTLEYVEYIENETMKSYVKREFQTFAKWQHKEDVQLCIDLAFKALRQSEERISQLEDKNWQSRDETIQFRVGQIVRHKKYGYRGVITGWDKTCKQTLTWKRKNRIQTLKNNEDQPFYNLLVDRRDDQLRERTYCAQENLQDELECWDDALKKKGKEEENDSDDCLIECLEHPLINQYFDSFSFRYAKYRPNDELRALYPED
jgi:hemimethylated DNA binding protein